MKKRNKLLLLFCLLCAIGIRAQSTCATASPIQNNATFRGLDSFKVAERWHGFNGTNNVFKIKLYIKNYGSGSYSVDLYENNCSTLPVPSYTTNVVGDSIYIDTDTLPITKSYVIQLRNSLAPSYEVYDIYAFSPLANIILSGCTGTSCGYPATCNELVCNGGFECITIPVTNQGQISTGNCVNWTGANQGTPDLFTSNAGFSIPMWGVPCNGFGTQPGHNSSNSYAGLILYATGASAPFNEYVQTKLTSPLVAGKPYLISFYVSRGDRSYLQANSISIFLTGTQINVAGTNAISVTPKATVTNTTLLNDFNNWQLVTFCYVPTVSGEQFLTIGSPSVYQSGVTTAVNTPCGQVAPAAFSSISYLYIDDVSLQLLDVNSATYSACPNTTVQLQGLTCVPNASYSVNWAPSTGLNNAGIQNPIATLSTTTVYNTGLLVTSSNLQTCSASGQSTVFINPTPTITASASSLSVCPGQSTTLTGGGSSGTYTWLPGNIVGNNIVVSPSVTTTYTVSGVNSFGCVGQTTIQIIQSVPPTYTFSAVASPSTICSNFNQTTTLTASSNSVATTYTWNPGNLVGSVQTITPTATTIYTLNAGINGCVLTNTIAILVQSACCTQTIPAFVGTAFPTSTTGGITYISPLVFNNDVTIPSGMTVTFSDTEYLFAPGVKVIVSPGAVLNLRGCHLYACGTSLWQGIVVQNNGQVMTNPSGGTTPNYPLVEDATEAINVTANTTSTVIPILRLKYTTFNKNYVGVKIDTYQSNDVPYPFEIYGCTFSSRNFTFTPTNWPRSLTTTPELRFATTSTTGLTPPYGLQSAAVVNIKSPYNFTSSRAGIQLNDVGITSGSFKGILIGLNSVAVDFNLFDSQMFGVEATNSNVSNVNAVFQNTKYMPLCRRGCLSDGGSAIRSTVTTTLNAQLNLSASGTNSTSPSLANRFWDCHRSVEGTNVYQFNMDYSIHRSLQSTTSGTTTFLPGYIGVTLGTNRFQYYMTKNEFTNINNAINVPIIAGTYNVGSGNQTGIYAANMVINTNTFAPQTSTATAIGTNYLNNAISVSGANTTTWTNAPSTSLQINTNLLNRVYRGISLNGMNGYPSLVSNNTVSLTVDGLYGNTQQAINVVNTQSAVVVTTNTLMGAGTTSTLGNLLFVGSNNGTSSPSITCNVLSNAYQGFVFDNNNPGTYWVTNKMNSPLIRGMVLQNAGYINQQGSNSNAINNEWNGTWTFLTNYGTWTEGASTFANLSPLYTQSVSPYNPPFNSGNPVPQAYGSSGSLYYTTGSASCGGGGGGAMMASSSSLSTNTTLAATTNNAQPDDVKYLANTSQYRTHSNNTSLQSSYGNTSIGKFVQIEQANYNGNITTANSLNTAITATNTIEANYKNYNGLYYKHASNTFTKTDSTNLITLAQLCAGTNGACVYQARALYNSIYKTVLTVKDNCTYGINANSRLFNPTSTTNENITNSWSVDLFPNPNNGSFTVVSKIQTEELTVIITDISGKIIFNTKVITSNFISNLDVITKAGIYLITIKNSNNESITKKLVITN